MMNMNMNMNKPYDGEGVAPTLVGCAVAALLCWGVLRLQSGEIVKRSEAAAGRKFSAAEADTAMDFLMSGDSLAAARFISNRTNLSVAALPDR